uniref:Uncharacterized protein n=1 Tax=Oryza brachyantha TaxID=4533 RepID=J3L0M1_ORYBR
MQPEASAARDRGGHFRRTGGPFRAVRQDEAWEPKKERRIQQVPEGTKIKALHHFAMRCYAAPVA